MGILVSPLGHETVMPSGFISLMVKVPMAWPSFKIFPEIRQYFVSLLTMRPSRFRVEGSAPPSVATGRKGFLFSSFSPRFLNTSRERSERDSDFAFSFSAQMAGEKRTKKAINKMAPSSFLCWYIGRIVVLKL